MKKNDKNTFYDLVTHDPQYQIAVGSHSLENIENFKDIQRLLKYPLRPYQLEALSAFQLFWKDGFDSRSIKQKAIETITGHGGNVLNWPKIGFEMATGSGKTLLMGAIILYLWHKNYKDFLILTPNTILFDKTVENFTPRAVKSIFGDGWNLKYNLITGNSYRDKTCHYRIDRDISFYVFNMQKFYEKASKGKDDEGEDTMKGMPYVRRPLEESLWKDESGKHTISFMEFLKQRRPVIISDEAHHYQQKTTREAIFEMLPSVVVEFTGTSVEKNALRGLGQDNLYKYSMQRYIGEGYGKRIFALGCGTPEVKITDAVTESDKQKLIWGMIVHLLKREALKTVDAPLKKAMMLVKARSIQHAENVDNYLRNWPETISKELDDVLEQVNREQTDIVRMLRKYLPHQKKDRQRLVKDLTGVAKSVFTIHSENKSEEEVWTDYKTLDENKAEVVNQVRVFTEGVDYDHFYTIVVLGDTVENAGLAAAQLIGRGLRLFKEKREYDILDCDIKEQSEILHVICEKGKRFDKIVEDIRQKLDLAKGIIEIPVEEEEKTNSIKVKLIDDYKLPVLNIRSVATGVTFKDALKDKKLSIDQFIKETCVIIRGAKVLKPEVLASIEEVEVTSDKVELHQEKPKTTRRTLTLDEKDMGRWAWRFIEETAPFIGNIEFESILNRIKEIFKAGIEVDAAYSQDYRKALRALEKSIKSFHRDRSYELMFKKELKIRQTNVKELFKDSAVTIRKREGWTNLIPSYQPMSSHLQQKGVVVEGYKYSIRPYVKFDSPPEKWVADKLEYLCTLDKTGKSFWIRNEPKTEYPIEARPAPFYPDFLAYIKGKWAVIDVKGKHLAETKQIDERKKVLKLLEKEGKIITYFLVDKVMEKKGFEDQKIQSLDDFSGFDELRHAELGDEEFINGALSDLFKKRSKRT
ncbi:MAG: DEAD/DEAH box helicase family protein [Candidatus Omnitrophota bacterium]